MATTAGAAAADRYPTTDIYPSDEDFLDDPCESHAELRRLGAAVCGRRAGRRAGRLTTTPCAAWSRSRCGCARPPDRRPRPRGTSVPKIVFIAPDGSQEREEFVMSSTASAPRQRTQVAIVGAGPAGLTLAHLLRRSGIDAVVLEARSREYVEARIRAGVLEQGTVDLLRELGVGERLGRESMVHDRFELRLDGERHIVPVTELAGVPITVYGQQEVVKDLIALRVQQGEPLLFEAEVVELRDVTTERPTVVYTHGGVRHELVADAVVAADGFHGIGRRTIPADTLRIYRRDHPFAWLGVMAKVAPSSDHVVYANHADGLGMLSMRSEELTRLYLQVEPDARREQWPDERIWEHLHRRLATTDGWTLTEGPIIEFSVAPIRSFVAEPMRYGRLFLAGDSAHIVPPTGAKGLNLAVRDVKVLAPALVALVGERDERLADAYSTTCLQHVWWAQYFSSWLTGLVHTSAEGLDRRLALAELRTVVSRESARRLLAENYVGIATAASRA